MTAGLTLELWDLERLYDEVMEQAGKDATALQKERLLAAMTRVK